MGQFYGTATISYSDLDNTNKNFIDKILSQLKITNFDLENFYIRILPFHTDNMQQRYLHISEKLKQYLGSIHQQLTIHTGSILAIWQQELFKNGTKNNLTLNVTKRQLHLPIIVAELDQNRIEEIVEVLDLGLDVSEVEEISLQYKDMINNHVDNYEFFVKILTSYKKFLQDNRSQYGRDCVSYFIDQWWKEFSDTFSIDNFSPFLQETLAKIVMYKIINNRIRISRVLEGGE
jgi:hypothetical protein